MPSATPKYRFTFGPWLREPRPCYELFETLWDCPVPCVVPVPVLALALLPLAGRFGIVWAVPAERAAALVAMPEPQFVDPHDPVMTGENSFLRLSGDGGTTYPERASHWRVLWSPAGQGHVLFIESALLGSGPRIYADNAGVARFLQREIETLLHKPFAEEALPVIDANFERTGHSLSTAA